MAFRAGVEVCAKDALHIFAAPDSEEVIGELEVTELRFAAGGLDAAALPELAQVVWLLFFLISCFCLPYSQGSSQDNVNGNDSGRGAGDMVRVSVALKYRCAPSCLCVLSEGNSAVGESCEMIVARPERALLDSELERAIVLERARLEKRTRIAQVLQGNSRHTPESAMRAADRAVEAAIEAVTMAERDVEKDRAYHAATVHTMFGPRSREQNNAGLRAWAEGLLGERQALISGGVPNDAAEARLWNLAVEAVEAKIRVKRVESILADVLGRAESSATRVAALQEARARLGAVEEHRAKLASAHVGCLDTEMARRLVTESREQLMALEREWSQRGRSALSLVDELHERIERNKARAVELRAAKRARLGEQSLDHWAHERIERNRARAVELRAAKRACLEEQSSRDACGP